MYFTLSMPIFFAAIVGVYCAGKYGLVYFSDRFDKNHQVHVVVYLQRKAATVLSTLFTAGSIFFVRAVLRPLQCVSDGVDTTQKFMVSSPDVLCSGDNPEYNELRALVWIGMFFYLLGYAVLTASLVKAMRSPNPGLGLLGFMGDKYEKQFFYWCAIDRRVRLQTHTIALTANAACAGSW